MVLERLQSAERRFPLLVIPDKTWRVNSARRGTFRSTAEVIDGVRLAETMANARNSLPTLRELQDAVGDAARAG